MELVQQINVHKFKAVSIVAGNQPIFSKDFGNYCFPQFIVQSDFICQVATYVLLQMSSTKNLYGGRKTLLDGF